MMEPPPAFMGPYRTHPASSLHPISIARVDLATVSVDSVLHLASVSSSKRGKGMGSRK